MNEDVDQYARNLLKSNLAKCTEQEQDVFRRMYGKGNTKDMVKVVDQMPFDRIDMALQQVQNTLDKKGA